MNKMANKQKNKAKGQTSLDSFLGSNKLVHKENMGLDSNLRKSAIQKCRSNSFKPSKSNPPKKNTQRTITGGLAEGRCDEGTKICKACQFEKDKGKASHNIVHHPTCKRNTNYKLTNGGRVALADVYLQKYEAELAKNLKQPSSADVDATQDDFDKFFCVPCPSSNNVGPGDQKPSANDIVDGYSVPKLIDRVSHYMKNPTWCMRRSSTVPLVIAAAIETLLVLIPDQYKSGTNELMAKKKGTNIYRKLQAYRKIFPPGTLGFTFPRQDKTMAPDHYYSQLEGRTIYIVSFELNYPGWVPTCYKCGDEMIRDKYDFKSHGYATPIFDITGVTDYAITPTYHCKNCQEKCKGNDGRMLMNVPVPFRNAYPVDPRYAIGVESHLNKSFTKVMDKLFITHGNGNQLSIMLNELRADNYLDMEEEYFSQAIGAGVSVTCGLPSYEYHIGRYSPSGKQLRDLKVVAAESNLVSSGVSDKNRVRREMQSIGCDKISSSDHTFEFRKNYKKGLLPKEACGHTMSNNYGQIASFCIVPDGKQISYAHQAEQCTLRSNWNPFVHSTDTCPSGNKLWMKLSRGNLHCQLGLFHFLYRISKTFNEQSENRRGAMSELQECVYYYDSDDLEAVKKCLADGTIGSAEGQPCPEHQRESVAKTYRSNVRIYVYSDAEVIRRKLRQWLAVWKTNIDEKGERLFTCRTSKSVLEQMTKCQHVVDALKPHELYLEVKPSLKSTTGLSTYIGFRGAESKQEKGHHAIAHFANGGMRSSLADYLGMAGIAYYNLRIDFRLKLAKMTPAKRAKVPIEFQDSPHYTNHLRLSFNNLLGRQAGLPIDVHNDVVVLQPDNGERFFYEYYLQQKNREAQAVGNDKTTKRCLCQACGWVDNPYRKRKEAWVNQQDMQQLEPVATAPQLSVAAKQPAPEPVPLLLAPAPILPLVSPSPSPSVGAYSQLMAAARDPFGSTL